MKIQEGRSENKREVLLFHLSKPQSSTGDYKAKNGTSCSWHCVEENVTVTATVMLYFSFISIRSDFFLFLSCLFSISHFSFV